MLAKIRRAPRRNRRRTGQDNKPFLTQDVGKAAFLGTLLQAQREVDPVDDADNDGLPGDQIPQPIKQLPVKNMCLLPAYRI